MCHVVLASNPVCEQRKCNNRISQHQVFSASFSEKAFFAEFLSLQNRVFEKGICISVRGSFAMLDFEVIVLKSLDPMSYLTFRLSKTQKPSQGSTISPEKKFPSIEAVMEMLYRINNG
ncbi:hypothetical protein AVEN_263634-1 [Araneus ventricosus]|uniref:Uncharacterized protein n=1 Tax=Araneus ventricosus TaxID=182803 RepID=A0A4Y2ARN7_ARAVE|nr:hypothetical protein AVEN_263634-1 [Araneus ventricosus]